MGTIVHCPGLQGLYSQSDQVTDYNYSYTLRQRRSDETLREVDRDRAFLKAVEEGQLPRARYLLQLGADLDYRNDAHQNALHIAVERGLTDIVRFLVEAGADVNYICNPTGAFESSVLVLACILGLTEIVGLLLNFGAAVNGPEQNSSTPVCVACARHHTQIVQVLMEKGASISKWSILNLEDHEMAQILWPSHENMEHTFSRSDALRCLPLHIAIIEGNLDLTKILLESESTSIRCSAAFWKMDNSTWNSKSRFLARLAQTPDVTLPCLHLAVSFHRDHLLPLLLEYGADVNEQDSKGRTALHIASEDNELAWLIPKLIECGARLDIRDREGLLPWQSALRLDMHLSLRAFLDHGIDVGISARPRSNCSPLHLAATYGSVESTRLLLQKGMNIDNPLNPGEGDTTTPLHKALKNGKSMVAQLLIEEGASTKRFDVTGRPALHVAVHHHQEDFVQFLLRRGIDVSCRDVWGMTAASYAAWIGNTDCLRLLLQKGATLDCDKIFHGRTLFTNAVYAGYSEVIEILFNAGADSSRKDAFGWTPVELAKRLALPGVVNAMENQGRRSVSRLTKAEAWEHRF